MEVLGSFFLLMLCGFFSAQRIRAQDNDSAGFISIDCGAPDQDTNYTDAKTGLQYISDAGLIDTGISNTISPSEMYNLLQRPLLNLRSFPEGIRNCYSLKPSQGKFNKYLIRVWFYYGNYDGKNKSPEFDLYLGVDYWDTIKSTDLMDIKKEIIHVPKSDVIYVCLVNTGLGTPFISTLELRPLNNTMYTSITGSLDLRSRTDYGSNIPQLIRHKDDIYDRIWYTDLFLDDMSLNTSKTIHWSPTNYFKPPSIVMQTASVPKNSSQPWEMWWQSDNFSDEYYVYLYFSELQELQPHQVREFDIYINQKLLTTLKPISPTYLTANTFFTKTALTNNSRYLISLYKTESATLPPVMNAVEIYKVKNILHFQTDDKDTVSMLNIKITFKITRNWQGDPCAPQAYIWDGLNCSYNGFNAPRIISLNLSKTELTGAIPSAISNLTMLQTLDLSNNMLTGQIPDFLAEMASLKILYLNGNSFTGPIPAKLLQKSHDKLLSLSMDGLDGEETCKSSKCKKKPNVIIPVAISIGVLFLILTSSVVAWIIWRKIQGSSTKSNGKKFTLDAKKRQFTYSEILTITNNKERVLGKGGFGIVYHGCIDKVDVAVKIFFSSLEEGFKELQSKANVLMNIYHKNLVSLIGYCIDENNMGIIYEYMANGDLKENLSGNNLYTFTWEDRLRIAIDAAKGLEYMHRDCRPPIIHRDVKSNNILLNEKLEAKIADFGLCKTFPNDTTSHISTNIVVGTIGYLDPEYIDTFRLTEKSDVYSFGVVLLEIITGKHAIIKESEDEYIHVSTWISSNLKQNNINDVVDRRLVGKFDVKSSWKAIEVAMACVSHNSTQRPTMNQVVSELKECLAMEKGMKPIISV